jgi:hypothetical protein
VKGVMGSGAASTRIQFMPRALSTESAPDSCTPAAGDIDAVRRATTMQTIAGSYARYLMNLGHDADSAIETARASGEVPVRRTVRIVKRELSTAEAHQRQLGNLVTPATRYEVLGETMVVLRD